MTSKNNNLNTILDEFLPWKDKNTIQKGLKYTGELSVKNVKEDVKVMMRRTYCIAKPLVRGSIYGGAIGGIVSLITGDNHYLGAGVIIGESIDAIQGCSQIIYYGLIKKSEPIKL